jgi:hypothetical protein
MIPDPNTPEGMEEIKKRILKRKAEAESVRQRALLNPDEEPSGKLTNPSEMDRHRDRKNDE